MILQPGRNIWRLERAQRAAVLIDAASYYGALRQSLINARSSVFVVGWDLDRRTRLVGESGKAGDGYPEGFLDLLTALVDERPHLVVHLLVWNFSVLYALERDPFPSVSLAWRTPRRIRYCMDDDLPPGASHHQKIVVVDDSVAFCGGLDVTIRRWDTADHRLDEPARIDPTGAAYPPFHDVQIMVDGDVAAALAELARERWTRAACETVPWLRPDGDPWPTSMAPDFTEIDIGIARTLPACDDSSEVREVELLSYDALTRARRSIYIENQFLTATPIAQKLARRMREKAELEAVLVVPKAHRSWLETQVMRTGRLRFVEVLRAAGVLDRVALLSPIVADADRSLDVMVHSKVMIVDDRLLRVGSANLNNRSLGLDTECDLVIEADSVEQRSAIQHVRNRLLGHHCGVKTTEIVDTLRGTGSFIKTATTVSRGGHRLQSIADTVVETTRSVTFEAIADPHRPISPPGFLQSVVGERPRARRLRRLIKLLCFSMVIVALMLAWRFTPLADFAHPDHVRQALSEIVDTPGALLIVLATFVLGGLVVFPVLVLIAATAAAFGPWPGFGYATAGAMTSAVVTYGIGVVLGRRAFDSFFGPRLNRVRRSIVRRGVLAIAAVRLVPIAPFTVVNLVAGASRVPFSDYMVGTFIGMAPGIILMSALGYQIWNIMMHPTLTNILLFILAVIAWLGVSLAAQALLLRWRGGKV